MESSLDVEIIQSMNSVHITEAAKTVETTAKPIVRADFQEPLPSASSQSPKKNTKLKME